MLIWYGEIQTDQPLGFRPASFKALSIRYSNCPLTLRNSSAAHFSRADSTAGSRRSTKGFFFDKGQGFFSKSTNVVPSLCETDTAR